MLNRAIGLHDRVQTASNEIQVVCDRIENEVCYEALFNHFLNLYSHI